MFSACLVARSLGLEGDGGLARRQQEDASCRVAVFHAWINELNLAQGRLRLTFEIEMVGIVCAELLRQQRWQSRWLGVLSAAVLLLSVLELLSWWWH